jgi:hypothetical protein
MREWKKSPTVPGWIWVEFMRKTIESKSTNVVCTKFLGKIGKKVKAESTKALQLSADPLFDG